MADVQCDSCPQNAICTVIVQDLVKERSGQQAPVKFLCLPHTIRLVNACLAVPERYSIAIDPTGQKPRARATKNKNGATVKHDDLEKIDAEVNRFS